MRIRTMSNGAVRVLVSVAAIPLIIGASYFGKYFFLIFVLAVSLISYYEFSVLIKNKNISPGSPFGLISVALIVLNEYFKIFDNYLLIFLIFALLSANELFRNKGSAIINLGSTMLSVSYVGFFSAALINIREFYTDDIYLNGGYVIISVLATIWICDSAAYYIGTAFGKHKLFPRISPNKSWEGAAAGFVFAVVSMVLAKNFIIDFLSWNTVIGIAVVIGVLGQIGDLIESLFKRDAQVKDSSTLIPGHGGVFDRFDSLLFSAPFIIFLLKLFEK